MGTVKISKVKPKTHAYGWRHPDSQNALICQTPGFPSTYDDEALSMQMEYSDRVHSRDPEIFSTAASIAGTGDQGWHHVLPQLSPQDLKWFARVFLSLKSDPVHIRVVHHFNVSSGGSCPTVEALTERGSDLCSIAKNAEGKTSGRKVW